MFNRLLSLFRNLFRKDRNERNLSDELQTHLDQLTEEEIRAGIPPAAARRAALIELGGMEQVKEQVREVRAGAWLESLLQDLRYSVRMLRKSPVFAVVVILTLALGIGANTAIFSIVNGVILQPLPYPHSDRIVRIYSSHPRFGPKLMNSDFEIVQVQRRSVAFSDVTIIGEHEGTLTGIDEPEQVEGSEVSDGFLPTMGVSPIVGRAFLAEEYQPGHDQVVLLSYTMARRLFHDESAALGKTITLDDKTYTVVGVMPAGFHFPSAESPAPTNLWFPRNPPVTNTGNREVIAVGRLKKGVDLQRAQSELQTISAQLEQTNPQPGEFSKGWRMHAVPLQEDSLGDARLAIWIIFGSVSFVLLIACANVANLLLTRAASRQREMAIRTAVGAGRTRLVRQLLTESLLLALAGAAVGFGIAVWAIRALRAFGPHDIPRLTEVQINLPVMLFTAVISVVVALLFGLLPALRASKQHPNMSLKESGGTFEIGFVYRRRHRAQHVLLVGQVALSLVLMIGAGLLVRSFLRLTSVDLGFQPKNLLTLATDLSGSRYKEGAARNAFYQQTLDRIAVLPGVESVALSGSLSLSGGMGVWFSVEGRPPQPRGQEFGTGFKPVSEAYFRTMQIPLVQGRLFTKNDNAEAPQVAIVNRAFVARYFPNENAIGKRVKATPESGMREIVGVVGDVREDALPQTPRPQLYVPAFQRNIPIFAGYFVVRTTIDPQNLAAPIRGEIRAVDKAQPISAIQTMDEILSDAVASPRFRTELLGLFSLLALVLTAVGLYGVMAYSVAQRTHEVGIRLAVGAEPRQVLKMILRDGMFLVSVGIVIGLAGAFALTRVVTSMLFNVKATDPTTFVGVTALLCIVAFLACYIPARRAMRVDPMVALRYE
jgi:putative ABC transport system permease protein